MKQKLIEFYLDWTNNYLTAHTFAEHHGLDVDVTETLINIGRELHNEKVAQNKLVKTKK